MSESGWPTVRVHPRSMSQAFADERACAVEHYRRPPLLDRALGIALAIAVAVALGALLAMHV
jgi:hypothetical protein